MSVLEILNLNNFLLNNCENMVQEDDEVILDAEVI